MPALFPNSVRIYSAKTDLVDTVLAEHVNLLQSEVTAVQSTLGTGLLTSTWTGTFSQITTHTSVSSRLRNIEVGLLSVNADAVGAIPKSLTTTKGDMIVATSSSNPTRLPVGSNGEVLTADSTQTAGVRWSPPEEARLYIDAFMMAGL